MAKDGVALCAIIVIGTLVFIATIIIPSMAIHYANEYKVEAEKYCPDDLDKWIIGESSFCIIYTGIVMIGGLIAVCGKNSRMEELLIPALFVLVPLLLTDIALAIWGAVIAHQIKNDKDCAEHAPQLWNIFWALFGVNFLTLSPGGIAFMGN